jgi:transmembrane sensor
VVQSLDVQAAAWMVKLEAENPSEQDVSEFKEWVQASPTHRQACEEMIELWDGMNVLTQVMLPSELARHGGSRVDSNSWPSLGRLTLRHWAPEVFTLVLLVAALLIAPQFYTPSPLVYVTAVGEQKNIELADSSTVLLNTNSRLEVIYSEKRRQLKLIRGEAHFNVFHNPDRPFEVWAGKGLVRAIGTAFTVHIRKVDVEVIVTEGIVEVEAIKPEKKTVQIIDSSQERTMSFDVGIQVKAGNKLVYDSEELEKIKLVVVKQIEKDLSWQQGMLVFSGEPLAAVVEDVSRYTNLKIVIPERKTRELLVGGIFKVGDTESLFEVLQDGFDIHVERAQTPDNVVYLISGENR